MRSNKQKLLSYRLKRACMNLPLKMVLCIFVALMVVILIISAIPALLVNLCMGDHGRYECINDSHRLPINH